MEKAKKILNWVLIGLVIVVLLSMMYCLLSFAVYSANFMPN